MAGDLGDEPLDREATGATGSLSEPALAATAVKERAVTGVIAMVLRGVALRGMGFAATIVIARLLSPAEFGQAAVAIAVVTLGQVLTNGGLVAALVRRSQAPGADELDAALGIQLVLSFAVVAVTTVVAVVVDETLTWMIAVLALSLPMSAFRLVPLTTASRRLAFSRLAKLDVLEFFVLQATGVALVIAGAGAWGLVAAGVVRSLAGTILLSRAFPLGGIRPSLRFGSIRDLLRMSVQYQATNAANSTRQQGLTALTGALASAETAGLWNLAWRMLQPIFVVIQPLNNIAFAATTRLLDAGVRPRALLERGLALSTVSVGAVVVVLGAVAQDLVPLLFGDRWGPAATAVTLVAASLMINQPALTSLSNWLAAVGQQGAVLRMASVNAAISLATAVALLPTLGIRAVGVAFVVGALTDLFLLSRTARQHGQPGLIRALLVPLGAAGIAMGLGLVTVAQVDARLMSVILGGLAAETVFLGLLFIARREALLELAALLRERVPTRSRAAVAASPTS